MNTSFRVAATVIFVFALAQHCPAATYTLIDLGTLNSIYGSYGYGVNNSGQAVGISYKDGWQRQHAFLYSTGTGMTDLGTLGGLNSYAYGINDSGQVVGTSQPSAEVAVLQPTGDAYFHAFLYSSGTGMVDLGTLGGWHSAARAINDSGQVVGESYVTGNDAAHAFLYSSDTGMIDLGTLGGSVSVAYGINAGGQVVGTARVPDNNSHAFLYSTDAGMIDLGTLGGAGSTARGINDSGQVVGWASTSADETHAFLYDGDNGMTDLGTLGGSASGGYGINASGQVVGTANGRAFLYSSGVGMTDLNDLIPLSGWTLKEARAINDIGEIVGQGTIGGETHAFLLTPIPEPSSVVLAALGLVALVAYFRFQNRPRLSRWGVE
jgi:probable HAF family extracellular repeat protein